ARYDFFELNTSFLTSIYGYMAHLRHYGFRSPLLDWSKSEYVAAYFAFAQASEESDVSVYVLMQANAGSGSSNAPGIRAFGPIVRTHKRHFLQQCEYTLCATMQTGEWRFAEHESAGTDWDDNEENFLVNFQLFKFNIPGKERIKVLKLLDRYNLNAFSLFGSEESLMETMARRQFDF
ncbi:MAG: FRG domain-containing protein, partial [Rhizomicrobium sp.]